MGEPDADGWYSDYRGVPDELRPVASVPVSSGGKPDIDWSILGLVMNWRVVVADMAKHFNVDLYDPAVLSRPWPGVRTMIFSLLDSDSRLRRALTRG